MLLDRVKIRLAPHGGMGTECLDLAGKQDRAGPRLRVVEGFNSQRIAGQEEFAFAIVPEGEREHAIQPFHEPASPPHQAAEQHFGVAGRDGPLVLGSQLLLKIGEVVDLAVVDEHVPSVGRNHRLSGEIGQVQDSQSNVTQRHFQLGSLKQATTIRPAGALARRSSGP